MDQRKYPTVAEQHQAKCVHWGGLFGPGMVKVTKCDAGVEYDTVSAAHPSNIKTLPCFREQSHITTCAKRWFPTKEESEAHEREVKERSAKVLGALRHVSELVAGKRGIHGRTRCPVCGIDDALHYSVASVNGHIWGKCETDDCVSWMQ